MLLAKEPKRTSDVIRYLDAYYSQEDGDFAAGSYEFGSVLAKAEGKYVSWNPTGTDGSEKIVGLSLSSMKIDKVSRGVAVERHAIAIEKGLVFAEDVTPEQRKQAVSALKDLGIVIRQSI